jgi:drug/metabolite transporter (DMT)-like permease
MQVVGRAPGRQDAAVPRLFALSFIWGWSFLFIRVAGQDLTPSAVAAGRCALGALVLLVVLRVRNIPLPRDRRTLLGLLFVGGVGSAIPFTLLAWGGQHIDSGLSAVLNASTPLFTAGLAVPFLGERARPRVVAGLLLGFVGVAVVAGVGGDELSGTYGLAVLAPVLAGLFYGLTFCFAARNLMDIPSVVAATGQVVGATILLAPFAVVTTVTDGTMPGPRQVLSMLLLGSIGTGVAYMLSFRIIADLGPTIASLCTYIIPVVALVVGALVLDESITARVIVGGAITIAAVAVVTRSRQTAAPAPDVGAPAPATEAS